MYATSTNNGLNATIIHQSNQQYLLLSAAGGGAAAAALLFGIVLLVQGLACMRTVKEAERARLADQ